MGSSLHEQSISNKASPVGNMHVSTHPSSSAAKPTEYQKLAADSAMLAAGVPKPVVIERGSEKPMSGGNEYAPPEKQLRGSALFPAALKTLVTSRGL